MATFGNYYIDAPTLAGATAVFTDVEMTIAAPDGYYSDGTTVRQQVGGLLGIPVACPSCVLPCGSGVNTSGNQGVYELSFSAGADLGCTIIYFEPFGIPDGIRALWNGNTYNELTGGDGYKASTASPDHYTFIGNSNDDCGIAAQLNAGGYSGLDQYRFNGTSFDLIGTSGTITGAGGDVQLSAGFDPGFMTLYIPKNTILPDVVTVEMAGPCSGTAFNIEVNCPVLLTGVLTTNAGGGCGDPLPNTYYNVPNRGGTAGEPAVNEFYVEDQFGNSRVPAGSYVIDPPSGLKQIVVDANGVITSLIPCP